MFENLCTLPLSSELFALALHPVEPVLAVGLSGGHVQCFRLPAAEEISADGDADVSVLSTGTSTIDTEWRTRRHKGSCRTVGFSADGEVLYSAGTDSLLKAASSNTGQVHSKIIIPPSPSASSPIDAPTLLHCLSPQTLLLATDSGALHLYDLRVPSSSALPRKPAQTHRPHEDYISSLTPLKPTEESTSGWSKQWVSTGGTTLAVTDLRRGVLVKSEDQEEELLSSIFVSGLRARPGRSKGEKVLVGNSSGVITLWERGVWDDQDERIIVDNGIGGGESIDALIQMPDSIGDGKHVVAGLGDGSVRIIKLGMNKEVAQLRHDDLEGVVGLGFDVGGRLISGGGSIIKVWSEQMHIAGDEEEEGDVEDSDDDGDDDEGEDGESSTASKKRVKADSDDSDEEEEKESGRKGRKKRRKAKVSKDQGNGILGFKGL